MCRTCDMCWCVTLEFGVSVERYSWLATCAGVLLAALICSPGAKKKKKEKKKKTTVVNWRKLLTKLSCLHKELLSSLSLFSIDTLLLEGYKPSDSLLQVGKSVTKDDKVSVMTQSAINPSGNLFPFRLSL